MSKEKKTRNGPRKQDLQAMGVRGYAPVAELAKRYDVPVTTIYDWVRNNRISSPDERAISVKYRGNVWVLDVAVKAKVDLPAPGAAS